MRGPDEELQVLAKVSAAVVDRELRKIGEAELELETAQADMIADMDELKRRHEAVIRPLKAKVDALVARLEASVRAEKETLFAGNQTLALGFGKVSYRRAPDHVEPADGADWDEALRRMRAERKHQYLSVTYRPDKAALNKAASAGLLDAEALGELGLEVVEGEESWKVQTDHKAVREAVGQV